LDFLERGLCALDAFLHVAELVELIGDCLKLRSQRPKLFFQFTGHS